MKKLWGFLGLANYYRHFVQGFASIAHPLYQLTSKNAKGFDWIPHCQQAFDQLKQLLVSPPILAYPRFEIPFAVDTDASDHAIGGVFSHIQDGKERVIAYFIRQLGMAQRNYSTIEKEALAVVSAIQDVYPYLYGFHFHLYIDHNPLVSLKTVKVYGGCVSRWLLLFQFTVKYKLVGSSGNADSLSRRSPTVESNTLSTEADEESATTEGDPEIIALVQDQEPESLHMLSQPQSNDQVLQEVKIALLRQFQGKRDKLVQKKGVLYYQQTDSSPLQTAILTAYKEPSWSRYTTKGSISVSTRLWQSWGKDSCW